MKKSDRNLLLAAGAAAGGFYLWQKSKKDSGGAVAGFPGIAGVPGIAGRSMVGAQLPNHSLVPASLRGQCSPVWLDAALWGLSGIAVGYYGLAKKRLPI